ncbi:MAG TPA: metallophosphoesterase, partial [bacterium]|nr:metallophosphoesterase [bacterium]
MRHRSFLIFFAVFLLVLFGLHYYLWARLVRDTGLRMPWRALATAAIAGFGLLIPASFILMRAAPRTPAPLFWAVYLWMGLAFFLVVLLAVGDLARLPLWLSDLARRAPEDPGRRQFLGRLVAGTALLGAGGLSMAGLFGAAAGAIRVKRVRVGLSKLSPDLEGFRIVQVTDLHVGPTIGLS